MTPEFLAAVIDTLLPGDDVLPSGTRAGLDPVVYASSHHAIFDVIAARAGGLERFIQADESARAAALTTVERALPEAFRALLVTVLSDYYEATAVLAALGWRTDPPQPAGHAMSEWNDAAGERLERIRRRVRMWRAV